MSEHQQTTNDDDDRRGGTNEEFHIRIASSPEEIQHCQSLRHAIFVQEQKVPVEAEYDGKDEEAFHVICLDAAASKKNGGSHGNDNTAEAIIATGRVLVVPLHQDGPENSPDEDPTKISNDDSAPATTTTRWKAVLGRIAVRSDHRGKGLGRRVVRELERIAKSKGAIQASLTPHHYLERFYNSLGYEPSPLKAGENRLIHVNEHCQLIAMEKRLL